MQLLKKIMLRAVIGLGVAFASSGFTVTLVEKPGSAELAHALEKRDNAEFLKAGKLLQKALTKVLDNDTKAQVLAELGKLSIRSHIPEISPAHGVLLLNQSLDIGYEKAALALGEAYYYGLGVQPDLEKAADYYQRSIPYSSTALQRLIEIYEGKPEAAEYFSQLTTMLEKEKELNSRIAVWIARKYQGNSIIAANKSQAAIWYRRAIEAGSVTALMELAELWKQQGYQPSSDILALWRQAAENAVPLATLKLGFAYEEGKLAARDSKRAREYLEAAAAMNRSLIKMISRFYSELAQDHSEYYQQEELRWIRQLAKQEDAEGLRKLARYYRTGKIVPMDYQRARALYLKSILAGNTKAVNELAELNMKEQRWKEQLDQLEQKRKAKEADNKTRHFQRNKKKKEPSFDETLSMAKQGDIAAMREVGTAYLQGYSVVKSNATKGIKWLEKAAHNRDIPAMLTLARTYAAGSGVRYDLPHAYYWYQQAAEAGNSEAQYQLGLGYAQGVGVEKNTEKSRYWLGHAKKNGYALANEILESIVNGQ